MQHNPYRRRLFVSTTQLFINFCVQQGAITPVGYPTFEGYLKAKPAFGRTYYSYLIKLGRARDIDRHLSAEIGGAQLVEYARATDFPDLIGALIDATWAAHGDVPVRRLSKALRAYVGDHHDVYRKPGHRPAVNRRPGIVGRVAKLLDKLGAVEREQMVVALDAVLAPHRKVGSDRNGGCPETVNPAPAKGLGTTRDL